MHEGLWLIGIAGLILFAVALIGQVLYVLG